eukprot:gene4854-8439_t
MEIETYEVSHSSEKIEKWEILELQGRLESSDTKNSQQLGHLLMNENKCELIISNKLLDGEKKEKLKKPLVCLKKIDGKYVIQSVVEEKIVFKKRPQPLSPKTLEEKVEKIEKEDLEAKEIKF